MTSKQFNAALIDLGFQSRANSKGQSEFARQLGFDLRTVKRWAAGEWPVPVVVATLLNLMRATGSGCGDLKA
jgi:DNA-binding transcriptional regulator YiaG